MTSATGRVNNPLAPKHIQGFTLIEVLVVLVLISIIITFAVLSVDTGPEELRREGNKLASLLELTSEEAVMNGREYRALFQRQGYSFEVFQNSEWQAVTDDILRPRNLPDGMTLEYALENEPVDLADSEKVTEASLPLLSSGEIPSFQITVSAEETGKFIIREENGRIISRNT